MRYESAELTKIAINVFLTASVSATNMLAELCEKVGADWNEIVPTLRLDKRIGPHAYLSPGLGLAGGNLERDLQAIKTMAAENGTEAGLIDAYLTSSKYYRDWVLRKLYRRLPGDVAEPTISLWGLAYKPNTKSIKNSPALALLEALPERSVQAYDPQVELEGVVHPPLTRCPSPQEACRGADALILATAWPEFSRLDLTQVREHMRGRLVIDPFGCLDLARCRQLGFDYHKLGYSNPQMGSIA
jgi:UDPglucose 6-dehydrogenase